MSVESVQQVRKRSKVGRTCQRAESKAWNERLTEWVKVKVVIVKTAMCERKQKWRNGEFFIVHGRALLCSNLRQASVTKQHNAQMAVVPCSQESDRGLVESCARCHQVMSNVTYGLTADRPRSALPRHLTKQMGQILALKHRNGKSTELKLYRLMCIRQTWRVKRPARPSVFLSPHPEKHCHVK